MKPPRDQSAKDIDARIRKELLIAAKRLRDNKIFRATYRRWLIAAGLILLILGVRTFGP